MKQQLLPQQTIKERLNALIDAIVDRILDIEDYFAPFQKIKLTEGLLMLNQFLWFVWFFVFSVGDASPVYRYIYAENLWAIVFGLIFAAHFVSIFFEFPRVRGIVLQAIAIQWFLMLGVFAGGEHRSHASAQMVTNTIGAIVCAVKVLKSSND